MKFDDKEYALTIEETKHKRSLDANAYFWVFLDKLSAYLNVDKVTVYKELIRDIGGVSDTVCVQDKAVESLTKAWESRGLGWFAETLESKIQGCTNVVLYYGSSVYDTQQMSRLIDALMVECETAEIDTTPLRDRALLEGYNV